MTCLNEELIKGLNEKYLGTDAKKRKVDWRENRGKEHIRDDLKKLGEQYTKRIANLNKERIENIVFGFLFWIIPVITVYILGLAVRWIYRGFKSV